VPLVSRVAAVVLLFALACAHSPAAPPGPRPLTGAVQIQRAEASLDLALRYEIRGEGAGRQLEISAELRGAGSGSVGAVTVELRPDGFGLEGPAAWTGEAAAGQSASNTWRLRPSGEGIARVEVRHGLAGTELDTTTTAAFRVGADAIRLCATADCAGEQP
jgi:hypothetical protein